MDIKKILIGKYQRNKILVALLITTVICLSIGIYYKNIKETKLTFHYAFKDSVDKNYKLFFQRSSEVDSDKKVVSEIFNYKVGSIVNLTKTKAYFIANLPDNELDKIYEYDFTTNEKKIIYNNESGKEILDLYLAGDKIYFLSDDKIILLNLKDLTTETLIERVNNTTMVNKNLPYSFSYNEFFNLKNNFLIISYDKCKFVKEKCKNDIGNFYYTLNLKNKEVKKYQNDEFPNELKEISDFSGLNKVYKRGIIYKYEKDKGNTNYNIRFFTQF